MIRGILLCLCLTVALASQNIIFPTNQAATLVPGVGGANPTVVLAPININDPNQLWDLTGGFIYSAAPGYTNYVFDVKQGSNAEGTPIILWPKKTPTANNEQWSVDATGNVKSSITSTKQMYLAVKNGALVISATAPGVQAFQTPATCPAWTCASVGDPHISPYCNGRDDLFWPGSQQPGTYTLSKTGKSGDSFYTLIQADQQLCQANVPGIYCNQRAIINTAGHVVLIAGDTVTVDGTVVSVSGTYTVGNGVSVTRNANSNYVVTYPQGTLSVVTNFPYTDITVTTTSGPQPTGGACTKFIGPNTTSRKRALTPYAFLLSWRALNRTDDLFQYNSDELWLMANPINFNSSTGHVTTNNATLLAIAQASCAALENTTTLATQCAGNGVNSNAYYGACLDDVISTQNPSFGASITDAYAAKCAAYSNNTIALPTSARGSTASGSGIGSVVLSGLTQSFLITSRDVNGKVITTGGDSFVVTATGPDTLTFTIVYIGGGIYNVTYLPTTFGSYSISVTLQYSNIQNSPYAVNVQARTLDVFSVTGYSAQWEAYNGYATNLLPANGAQSCWNAANDWDEYYAPYWVTFDLGDVYTVPQFEYQSSGDGVHDPFQFELQASADPAGPYDVVQTFYGAAINSMQVFTLTSPESARYWKFNIISTYSGEYQAYVCYVNFMIQ